MTDRHFRQLLRSVVSNAPVILFAIDKDGVFTLSDGAGLQALGLKPGQVVGLSCFDVYKDHPQICDHIRRCLAGEQFTETVQLGDLTYVTSHSPMRNDDGEIVGVIGVASDITAQRQAQRELQETEARFQALYEKTPVMLHSIDREGRIVNVSDEWCRVLGYERDEILGRKSVEFLTPASRRQAEQVNMPRFFQVGYARNLAYQFVKKSGELVDVLLSSVAEKDTQGDVVRYMAVLIDVTERNRMQAQLMQTDRMASLGTLAAGVAHEINNPLSYVINNIRFLRQLCGEDEEVPVERARELLRAAHEGAERVRRIVEDLRVFTRPDLERIERVDVNHVLESVLQLARSVLRHGVRLEVDLGEVQPVAANEARLAQVFLNLVVNAAHAIQSGGDDNLVRISSQQEPGGVRVDVEDSGTGIPEELRERIFDPFFTTKPVGKGSGLGLAIGHSIMTSLGGSIAVEDREGGGARFVVRIPTGSPSQVSPPQQHETPRSARKGTNMRVLVVDDDEGVATSLAMVFEGEFKVTVANSGKQALELVGANPYDAVLCDVLMDDMVAAEVHEGIRELQPELSERVVFMTGAITPGERAIPKGYPVLQKPFDVDVAVRLLQELGAR